MPQKTYNLLQKICKKHKVFPRQILELECWTWEILQFFTEQSKLYGTESKEKEFQTAKQNIATGKIYHQSLNSFRLPFQWQLIYCTNTAFNKLTKFSDREKVFNKAAWHLEPYGLFIFHIHTEKYYQNFNDQISYIEDKKNNTYTITQNKKWNNNSYSTKTQIFSKDKDEHYKLSEYSNIETTFSINQIKKSLLQYFENISTIDPKGKKTTTQTNSMYIICQKWRE